MPTYAIADIHGTLASLDTLLAHIAPTQNDTLIFLGDYIDRGPDSPTVLKRIRQLQHRTTIIPLMGNHEEMALQAREALKRPGELGLPQYHDWLVNGGYETVQSYGGVRGSLKDIPPEDFQFMQSLLPYHETATHIFVHAGLDPNLPLEQQTPYHLRWTRFFDPLPHISGKIMICGHTAAATIRVLPHAICLDTAAYKRHGLLTALNIDTSQIIQASTTGRIHLSSIN